MTLKVMISYPSEKLNDARKVYNYLAPLGLDVWFDKESLVAGDNWDREISEAIHNAELVVLISSDETVKKPGVVQRELNKVLERVSDLPIGSNYIINIRTESVALPRELSKYQWIDLFEDDWSNRLLRAVLKKFKQLDRPTTPQLDLALAALSAATETYPRSINEVQGNHEYSCSFFTYNGDVDYIKYVNAEIVAEVYRNYYSARADFNYYTSFDPDKAMSWSLQLEEVFREGDLISLRFFMFQDSGGAHPSHGIYTLNFAGQNQGKIEIGHLVSYNEDVAKYIIDFIQIDIERQFRAIGESMDINIVEWTGDKDRWKVLEQFNFNRNGITFNLSPYDVLPYAYGSHEVFMPWHYFRDKLNDSLEGGLMWKLVKDV